MFTGRKDGTEETRVTGDIQLEALACENLNFTDEGNTRFVRVILFMNKSL